MKSLTVRVTMDILLEPTLGTFPTISNALMQALEDAIQVDFPSLIILHEGEDDQLDLLTDLSNIQVETTPQKGKD